MYAVNHLPLIDMSKSTTGCCTLIDPADWDEKEFTFDNKLFAKVRTRSFLHVPTNMAKVMKHAQEEIDQYDAADDEWIILSHETTPWHADHYFAISREVPTLETGHISGTFVTKVFEGKFKDAPKWHAKLQEYARSLGKKPVDTFFFYTVCPNCAKAYGKNYVVGFSQVAQQL